MSCGVVAGQSVFDRMSADALTPPFRAQRCAGIEGLRCERMGHPGRCGAISGKGVEELLDGEAGGGVEEVGGDLGEGLEDEAAEMEFGVREGEAVRLQSLAVVEEQVEVERAWAFEGSGGAVAAQALLDVEEAVEEIEGQKGGLKEGGGVEEAGLVWGWPHGRGVNEAGHGYDGAESGKGLNGGVKVGLARAEGAGEIGAEGDGGEDSVAKWGWRGHWAGGAGHLSGVGGAGEGGVSGFGLLLRLIVVNVGKIPGGAVFHEAADEGGVHGVAGAFCDDAALDAAAGEGKVADEVENLVANELVVEAEGAVLDFAGSDEDGAGVGRAADEAHVAEHGFVFAEAEGASGCDEVGIGAGVEVAKEARGADGRGEVDAVVDLVAGAGIDTDELGAVFAVFRDFNGFQDAQVFAAATLGFEAGAEEGFDVRQGGAVEDGNFEVVELDDDVVDAVSDESREQVLRGGDEDALAHEGRSV